MCFCAVNPLLLDAVSKLIIARAKCEFYGLQRCEGCKNEHWGLPELFLLHKDLIKIKHSLVVQILKKLLVGNRLNRWMAKLYYFLSTDAQTLDCYCRVPWTLVHQYMKLRRTIAKLGESSLFLCVSGASDIGVLYAKCVDFACNFLTYS